MRLHNGLVVLSRDISFYIAEKCEYIFCCKLTQLKNQMLLLRLNQMLYYALHLFVIPLQHGSCSVLFFGFIFIGMLYFFGKSWKRLKKCFILLEKTENIAAALGTPPENPRWPPAARGSAPRPTRFYPYHLLLLRTAQISRHC